MTKELICCIAFLFPGIIAHYYYQFTIKKELFSGSVVIRAVIISLFAYICRGMVGVFQGYGNATIQVYFETVDNLIKYVLFSIISSFLLINSYIYLEQNILPLWKGKQTDSNREGKADE